MSLLRVSRRAACAAAVPLQGRWDVSFRARRIFLPRSSSAKYVVPCASLSFFVMAGLDPAIHDVTTPHHWRTQCDPGGMAWIAGPGPAMALEGEESLADHP